MGQLLGPVGPGPFLDFLVQIHNNYPMHASMCCCCCCRAWEISGANGHDAFTVR